MLEGMLQMQLDLFVDVLTLDASISSSVNPDPKASQTSSAALAQEYRVWNGESLERQSKDRCCGVFERFERCRTPRDRMLI